MLAVRRLYNKTVNDPQVFKRFHSPSRWFHSTYFSPVGKMVIRFGIVGLVSRKRIRLDDLGLRLKNLSGAFRWDFMPVSSPQHMFKKLTEDKMGGGGSDLLTTCVRPRGWKWKKKNKKQKKTVSSKLKDEGQRLKMCPVFGRQGGLGAPHTPSHRSIAM